MSKFENFSKALEKISEAQRLLERGPASYYVTEITGAYEYLMDRFCPFKVGDRVMLKAAPNPMPSGWESSKHFLVRGAVATIAAADCGPRGFVFDVIFDDESWIKKDFATKTEEVVPVEEKHRYGFLEESLVKI